MLNFAAMSLMACAAAWAHDSSALRSWRKMRSWLQVQPDSSGWRRSEGDRMKRHSPTRAPGRWTAQFGSVISITSCGAESRLEWCRGRYVCLPSDVRILERCSNADRCLVPDLGRLHDMTVAVEDRKGLGRRHLGLPPGHGGRLRRGQAPVKRRRLRCDSLPRTTLGFAASIVSTCVVYGVGTREVVRISKAS